MTSEYRIKGEQFSLDYYTSEGSLGDICGDHCHDRYEISYLLSVSGRCIVEGSEQSVTSGTLLLINPMSYHRVDIDTDENTEVYTVFFERDFLPESTAAILDLLCSGTDSHGKIYSVGILSDSIINAFDRFEIAYTMENAERIAYAQALLSEIVILLSCANGENMNRRENELGARVASYLNGNIKRNISLDRLARRFFVSKYHLCRAFKSYSGTTVHAYVNHKRILYAKKLIESGVTASAAAEQVGFGDYSSFYRAYVKFIGRSPTA